MADQAPPLPPGQLMLCRSRRISVFSEIFKKPRDGIEKMTLRTLFAEN